MHGGKFMIDFHTMSDSNIPLQVTKRSIAMNVSIMHGGECMIDIHAMSAVIIPHASLMSLVREYSYLFTTSAGLLLARMA